jgi:hypothetical protein
MTVTAVLVAPAALLPKTALGQPIRPATNDREFDKVRDATPLSDEARKATRTL